MRAVAGISSRVAYDDSITRRSKGWSIGWVGLTKTLRVTTAHGEKERVLIRIHTTLINYHSFTVKIQCTVRVTLYYKLYICTCIWQSNIPYMYSTSTYIYVMRPCMCIIINQFSHSFRGPFAAKGTCNSTFTVHVYMYMHIQDTLYEYRRSQEVHCIATP